MAQRNRNSLSSCGVYPLPTSSVSRRHCSSVASLDNDQMPTKNRQPRQSHTKTNKQASMSMSLSQYPEIERMYLKPLYDIIHGIRLKNCDEYVSNHTFLEWDKTLRVSITKLRELHKNTQEHLTERTKDDEKSLAGRRHEDRLRQLQTTIEKLNEDHQQELKQREIEINNKILEVSTQFGKREQQYKEAISKCVQAMNNAHKKLRTHSHSATITKLKKVIDGIRGYISTDSKNRQVYQAICKFTEQLEYEMGGEQQNLKPLENYPKQVVFQQSPHNENLFYENSLDEDRSLESIGVEEIVRGPYRNQTIDMSSIAVDEEQYEESMNIDQHCAGANAQGMKSVVGSLQQEISFQECLGRMICWNFFGKANHGTLSKLMQILKDAENPEFILYEPIYPIIVEACKLAIRPEDDGDMELEQIEASKDLVDEFKQQLTPEQGEYMYKPKMSISPRQLRQKSMGALINAGRRKSEIPKSTTFKI